MARLLIRRQAEGTWILACLQHVVACWDSRPDDWMGQKETFLLASDCFIIFPGLLHLIYSANLARQMERLLNLWNLFYKSVWQRQPPKTHLEKGDLGMVVKLIFYYHRSQVATAQNFLLAQGVM